MNLNNLFKNLIINPPKKPAIKAPKNPELISTSSEFIRDEKVVPAFAIAPPTIPTANPGLSPILIAMYPDKIISIKSKAIPPIVLKNAAIGVFIPKFEGFIE